MSIVVYSAENGVTSNWWADLSDKQRKDLFPVASKGGYVQQNLNTRPGSWQVYVYWVNSKPVACCWLHWKKNGTQALAGVYVKTRYRRQGIGSLLLRWATDDNPDARIRVYHWDRRSRAFFLQAQKDLHDRDIRVIKEWL